MTNLKFVIFFVVCLTIFAATLKTQNNDTTAPADASEAAISEKGKKLLEEIEALISKANDLADKQRFGEASTFFDEAQGKFNEHFGELPDYRAEEQVKKIDAAISNLMKRWADYLEQKANAAFMEKKYDEAAILCQNAIVINPGSADKLQDIVKKCQDEIVKISSASASETLEQEEKRREEIAENAETLVSEAKRLARKEKFGDAEEAFAKAKIKFKELSGSYAQEQLKKLEEDISEFREKWAEFSKEEACTTFIDEESRREAILNKGEALAGRAETLAKDQSFAEAEKLFSEARIEFEKLSSPYAQKQLEELEKDISEFKEKWASSLKQCQEICETTIEGIAERQKKFDNGKALVTKAETLLKEQKFEEAETSFSEARTEFEKLSGPYAMHQLKNLDFDILKLKIEQAKALEQEAHAAFIEKKYDKAIVLYRDAMQINPDSSEKLEHLISKCEKEINSVDFKEITDWETFDPERPVRTYEIDASLKQAEVLIKNEQYIRARDTLEKILVRDPYNQKATMLLKDIYVKLFNTGRLRRDNDSLERMAEVRWKWNEAVLPLPAEKPPVKPEISTSGKGLYDRLTEIIIDQIEFEEATITSVVTYLKNRSKEVDPSPEKKGVNIVLNIKGEDIEKIPLVTMSFDSIPIGEAIRYICQGCGLEYRIEEHAVIISDQTLETMETRFFNVRAALIASIVPSAEEEEGEERLGAEEDFFETEETFGEDQEEERVSRPSVTSEALIAYFTERGVPFPERSTIAYDRRAGKLVIKNTLENLRRLEQLLRALDLETPLVLIEAKFVELAQTDLEDLSLEWLFSQTGAPITGLPTVTDNTWTITQNASLVRPLGTNFSAEVSPIDATVDRIGNNVFVLPAFGPNNNRNLQLILHALDRSGRTEVLSAPKVIAASGQTAIIRMVREEYYPESWTEPELTIPGNSVVQYTPSYPELGDPTDVGIRFEVTPNVSPNNYTISLVLNPQVVDRTGWTNYSYTVLIPSGAAQTTNVALLIMPELSRRDVSTTVKVYDGETLVLGGMLRETFTTADDRIPFLGDIPLLGRLARAKNESSVKRNLLIFVTARLVNPDGLPVRVWETKGLPDFRR